ncbi:putative manganese transporter [Pseudoalteromonas haloplanktis]|uniref:Manganese transporter n=1 Tax=Pseudoalteromonas haloplanktis TaxID=228 RepID=A0ABU1B8B2_PSEHA|nr:putative manganese transporter [Pseudoalteromonas haloplanktis]MDQ9090769.1 putative manganese transporter [Pseudoalteromonas haloplanktis]
MFSLSLPKISLPTSTQFIMSNKRLLLPLFLLVCLAYSPMRTLTLAAMSDAFFQVSVFVAATLFIYYYVIDRLPQLELGYLSQKSPLLEVSFASLLGALPGCGGAIIVVTQFTKGQASFGSVVAVLTATMGDAAFLLLATKPVEGLLIMFIGLSVGIVSGSLVNALHKPDHLRPAPNDYTDDCLSQPSKALIMSKSIWQVVLIPSVMIAIMIAINTDFNSLNTLLADSITLFGAAMALVAVATWAFSSKGQSYQEVTSEEETISPPSKLYKVLQDTHFVTAWVVASFMLFEILITFAGVDLKAWFAHYAYLAPLIAVVIGFLPGCGPQIVVTTLYIQGIIPFSALAANAISNDGDALFPAIAMAPRAAFVATIYSAVPAILVGYGLYFYGL